MRRARQEVGRAEALAGAEYTTAHRAGEALRSAEQALHWARLSGDRGLEARALGAVGEARFHRNEPALALAGYQSAAAIWREAGDRRGEATALKNAGIARKYLGDYEAALEDLHRALELFQGAVGREEIASTLENLGTGYASLGAYPAASEHYERALALRREANEPAYLHRSLIRLGFLQLDLGFPDTALEYFDDARPLVDRYAGVVDRHWTWMGTSAALAGLGRIDEAIAARRRALQLARRSGDERAVADDLAYLGHLLTDRDPSLAIRHLEMAVALHRRSGASLSWGAHGALARAYRRQGHVRRAIASYTVAIDLLESVRRRLRAEEHRATFFSRHHYLYAELIEALLDLSAGGADEEAVWQALETLERGRARALLEALLEARGSVVPPPDLGPAGPPLLSRKRMRSLLDPGSALLAYAVTRERVHLFVLARGALHAERLPTAPDVLAARVETFTHLLGQGHEDGWRAIGKRLHGELLEPALKRLAPGIERLIILADGPLHSLPFEALAAPRFLVEDFAVSYAPSAAVLAELAGPGATPGRLDLLVMADPAFLGAPQDSLAQRRLRIFEDDGLRITPLPFSVSEARTIAREVGPRHLVLSGEKASEAWVKREQLSDFRILHFATHAFASPSRAGRAALVLAPGSGEDGLLEAREIFGIKLHNEMVVLSACRTARGRLLSGEGIQGLARAFLQAGARSVVGSLWNVNDQETAGFMAAFYRHLASGASKGEALRRAKRDFLARAATAAPRHWAPFVLIGEAGRTVGIAGPPWWRRKSALVVPAIGLLAGLVLYLRQAKAPGQRGPRL